MVEISLIFCRSIFDGTGVMMAFTDDGRAFSGTRRLDTSSSGMSDVLVPVKIILLYIIKAMITLWNNVFHVPVV